jgi:hypothetical protein
MRAKPECDSEREPFTIFSEDPFQERHLVDKGKRAVDSRPCPSCLDDRPDPLF